KEVEEILKAALPKASRIIYRSFCRKYRKPETNEGLTMTEKFVGEILFDPSSTVSESTMKEAAADVST
ncbi:MAG: hypothetical protein GY866_17920, partial [Proteobacteria bacterium]|nr:hypothetical protein [Pseudomonadota bacterium]